MVKFLANFRGIFATHSFSHIDIDKKIPLIEDEINKNLFPPLVMKKISELNPNFKYEYTPYKIKLIDLEEYCRRAVYCERNFHIMDKVEKQQCKNFIDQEKQRFITQQCNYLEDVSQMTVFRSEYEIKEKKINVVMKFNLQNDKMMISFVLSCSNYNNLHRKTGQTYYFNGFLDQKTFLECNVDEISNCINKMLKNAENIIIQDHESYFGK